MVSARPQSRCGNASRRRTVYSPKPRSGTRLLFRLGVRRLRPHRVRMDRRAATDRWGRRLPSTCLLQHCRPRLASRPMRPHPGMRLLRARRRTKVCSPRPRSGTVRRGGLRAAILHPSRRLPRCRGRRPGRRGNRLRRAALHLESAGRALGDDGDDLLRAGLIGVDPGLALGIKDLGRSFDAFRSVNTALEIVADGDLLASVSEDFGFHYARTVASGARNRQPLWSRSAAR